MSIQGGTKMASKPKKRKTKEEDKKNYIEFKYGRFEMFTPQSNQSAIISKLKLQVSGTEAVNLRSFIHSIKDSPECKAYIEMRNEYLDEFNAAQEKLPAEKRKPAFSNNIPKWMKLIEEMSPIKIEKFKVDTSQFPKWKDEEKIFTALDMDVCDDIFEFI